MKHNIAEDITGMVDREVPIKSSQPSVSTGANINIPKKDLNDPSVQRSLSKMKDSTVNIVDESQPISSTVKLKYLSNIKDWNTGEISKPFSIGGKNYQMVRALTSDNRRVNGVYCLDEVDESGENIIHSVDHFEKNIAKQPASINIQETSIEKKEPKPMASLQLSNYKFFFVNQKTGKVRKFKTAEDLAKATITNEETFMNLTDFKKYVSGTLFGKKEKKSDSVEELNEQSPEAIHMKAVKLVQLIGQKIPKHIFDTIKINKEAQKEVLINFATLIGIPIDSLPNIVSNIKNDSSNQASVTTINGADLSFEHKVISKDALIKETLGIKKTVKIKDIK